MKRDDDSLARGVKATTDAAADAAAADADNDDTSDGVILENDTSHQGLHGSCCSRVDA